MAEAIPLWVRVKLALAVAVLLIAFFIVAARVVAHSHAEDEVPVSLTVAE